MWIPVQENPTPRGRPARNRICHSLFINDLITCGEYSGIKFEFEILLCHDKSCTNAWLWYNTPPASLLTPLPSPPPLPPQVGRLARSLESPRTLLPRDGREFLTSCSRGVPSTKIDLHHRWLMCPKTAPAELSSSATKDPSVVSCPRVFKPNRPTLHVALPNKFGGETRYNKKLISESRFRTSRQACRIGC